jgi:hypothetical protein
MVKPSAAPAFVRHLLIGSNLEQAEAAAKEVLDADMLNLLPDDGCEAALRASANHDVSPLTRTCASTTS